MRELHHSRTAVPFDDGDQTGTCRHDRRFLIHTPPIWVQLWDPFFLEVDCKDLCEFRDTKGSNGYHEALQQSTGVLLIWLFDLLQYPLIRLVQTFRQLLEDASHAWWETVA